MPESRDESAARPRPIDEAKRGHRECMEVLAEVERCVDRTPDEAWVTDLMRCLPNLRESLQRHFTEEESGTLYDTMPMVFPHLSRRFEELRSEHPRLLENVDEILGKAEKLEAPETYELRELDAHVQLLLARIRRHEAQENELVFEAVWREVGVGD